MLSSPTTWTLKKRGRAESDFVRECVIIFTQAYKDFAKKHNDLIPSNYDYDFSHIIKECVREKTVSREKDGFHDKLKRLDLIIRNVERPGRLIGGAVKSFREIVKNSEILDREDLLGVAYEAIFKPTNFYQNDYMEKVENGKWTENTPLRVVIYQLIRNAIYVQFYRVGFEIKRHGHQAIVEKQVKKYLREGAPYLQPNSKTVKQIAEDLGLPEKRVREVIAKPNRKGKTAILGIGKTANNRIEPSEDGWGDDSAKTFEEKIDRVRPDAKDYIPSGPGKISPEFEPVRSKRHQISKFECNCAKLGTYQWIKAVDEMVCPYCGAILKPLEVIHGKSYGEYDLTDLQVEKILGKPLNHVHNDRNKNSYRRKWKRFVETLLDNLNESGELSNRKYKIAKKYIGGLNQDKISKIWRISQATVSRRINEINKELKRKLQGKVNK